MDHIPLRWLGYQMNMGRTAVVKILVTVLVVIGAGVLIFQMTLGKMTAEKAIQQAKEYQPQGGCTMALVPAEHKATGARYTFMNGCLAPGWEPVR